MYCKDSARSVLCVQCTSTAHCTSNLHYIQVTYMIAAAVYTVRSTVLYNTHFTAEALVLNFRFTCSIYISRRQTAYRLISKRLKTGAHFLTDY